MSIRDIWLILHFLGIALGPGCGFAILVLFLTTRRMPPGERQVVMAKTRILGLVAPMGLAVLIISGFGLALPGWSGFMTIPLFQLKLALVALLVGLVAYGQLHPVLARKINPDAPAARPPWLVPLPFAVAAAIIIVAVLIFH